MEVTASSVFQRKDGMWVARYIHNGKRKHTYSLIKEEAVQKRQDIINALSQCNGHTEKVESTSVSTGAVDITLCEWLEKWLETYVMPNKSKPTYKGYCVYVNRHITPVLGSVRLKDISSKLFQDFFNTKARDGRIDGKPGGMSPQSLENMRFMLKAAMDKAEENNLIPYNFIVKVKINKPTKKEIRVLSLEEESKLINACRNSNKSIMFGIIISLGLGLKLGELLALRWSDIDMDKKQISVRYYLSRCNDNGKTALRFIDLKSGRTLYVNVFSDELISDIRLYMEKTKAAVGFLPETVIATQKGMPVDPGYFNRLFKRIFHVAGVECANFDILRNTFILRSLNKGFSFTDLHMLLGCGKSSKSLLKLKPIIDRQ